MGALQEGHTIFKPSFRASNWLPAFFIAAIFFAFASCAFSFAAPR
eukprot:CAMPEP_0176075846 /NCGR_PEP_ID=MMETSP0120_2-20121206/37910_1 /TAXON_ID=160619 /ORGANISM="Kryptoperidinium foliaceum, Strain CCMP 1326" /LENGTH=44 /DNA_ID= /DNA_START= /DNA_END= /DNA_ORIENTATION=